MNVSLKEIWVADGPAGVMSSLTEGLVIKELGLELDRYSQGKGIYQKPTARKTVRDLSGISSTAFEGTVYNSQISRRNLVFNGSPEAMNSWLGWVFRLGAISILGVEWCDPCEIPAKGFLKTMEHKGGIRFAALGSGLIKVEDELIPQRKLGRYEFFKYLMSRQVIQTAADLSAHKEHWLKVFEQVATSGPLG